MRGEGENREREAKRVFVPHTCWFSELVSRTIAHFCVEPMHHPDRLACLHERPRIYKPRCNGYTCTGCYLNFSPSNRIILREILIGIDRRKVARSPRKSYRYDSMLFSLKIKKREKRRNYFSVEFLTL